MDISISIEESVYRRYKQDLQECVDWLDEDNYKEAFEAFKPFPSCKCPNTLEETKQLWINAFEKNFGFRLVTSIDDWHESIFGHGDEART